ncbi:MAG: glycosyl hydrolase family 16, partial [Saprospiraceae bacterium]
MKKNIILKSNLLLLLGFVLLFSNCEREIEKDLKRATYSKDGTVFIDGFSAGLEYLPFGDSYFSAFTVDEETKYAGTASMRFDVPNVGDPNGAYAGAIFPDNGGRDLSGYDALTFWAKSSTAATINDVGFGQDFGENKHQVTLSALKLTTNWRQYTIALPDASKLTREKGLFWYAEGPENGNGYTFWIDELQFEKLGTIAQPRPAIQEGEDITINTFLGVESEVTGLQQTLNLGNGLDQTLGLTPAYFEFSSSNTDVATVNAAGVISSISSGTAVITAKLNGVDAAGSVTVAVTGNFTPAPTPTQDAA